VVVGVHSPEFEFEKNAQNVEKAIKDFGITYPVVQDNDFAIWKAYNNQYWPAHYLIDQDGKIRYQHFGEGNYVETENAIRSLIGQKMIEGQTEEQVPGMNRSQPLTPETYLGWSRADAYVLDNQIQPNQTTEYLFNGRVAQDAVALKGKWQVNQAFIEAQSDQSSLFLNFSAHQVYLVLDKIAGLKNAKITVLLDSQPVPEKYQTKDMNKVGEIEITDPRKYDLIDLGQDYGRHTLEIRFPLGVQAFAFTFG
jgi:hypothetical protein